MSAPRASHTAPVAPSRTQPHPVAPVLRRELGRWDLTAIGVNQVIGSAIFLLPANVAKEVGAWGPVAFLAVGAASLLIALCFAEVGSRFERTGGPYLPARVAFGRFIGFEVGWMMWFTRVASQASVANGLALALAFYWPGLSEGVPRMALITFVTLALTWINIRGIKQSSWVVNALTIGKLLPLLLFISVGIWFIDPSRLTNVPDISLQQAGTAALLLVFAYGGYEVTGVPAGEAANPRRDVPFAFVMTITTVAIIMTLTSVVATGVLPDVAASRTPLADGAALFLGAVGALIISVGSAISMTGNNMGQVLTGSRTIFALAENGDLPRWFAHVHPRHQTPSNAILFTAGVALDPGADRLVRPTRRGQRGRAAGHVPRGVHRHSRAAAAVAGWGHVGRSVHRAARASRACARIGGGVEHPRGGDDPAAADGGVRVGRWRSVVRDCGEIESNQSSVKGRASAPPALRQP